MVFFRSLKKIVLGDALKDEQLKSEKLSRLWGLPIMASDAVSSVAYAVEEILLALVPALGIFAVNYVSWVSLPIILLLLILVFSYSQIIESYPNGGGSYVVSKEMFGRKSSLLAAACLVVDYIMTVAVSISSSTANIIAVFPSVGPYKVLISLICVLLITLINLRGTRESSKVFGIPTYAFIILMAILIITGFIRYFTNNLPPITTPENLVPQGTLEGITLILFLRAFSSGCSALTGVEAVSNAIPSFTEPSRKTAKHVLFLLGGIIVFIFGGTSFLASFLKVIPIEGTTVLAQMGAAVFGNGIMFFALQFITSLILLLAANTAYNGLPILLSILAKDKYMPRQFLQRGTKLSFSNGIVFISVAAGLLLIAFKSDTHKLIPFYSVGVFVSFTISQFGMFIKWIRSKEKGWQYKVAMNGFGAILTFICTIVVFTTKFTSGAWVLLVVIPILMLFMSYSYKHYFKFLKAISVWGYNYEYTPSKSHNKFPCIVLISSLNKASLKTFEYAKEITSNIIALHISTSNENTKKLKSQWENFKIGIPLTVIDTPYRNILLPIEEFISEKQKSLRKGECLTVVLTRISGGGWKNTIFHNQTTFFIQKRLEKNENVATILVPYFYNKNKSQKQSIKHI